MAEFKDILKQRRVEIGLTQDELAKMLDVSKSSVALWEAGRRFPNASCISRLDKILGIPLHELFDLIESSKNTYVDTAPIRQAPVRVYRTTPNNNNVTDMLSGVGGLDIEILNTMYADLSMSDRQKVLKYIIDLKKATQDLELKAAHMNKDATPDQIQHDNDIMEDDSEWE